MVFHNSSKCQDFWIFTSREGIFAAISPLQWLCLNRSIMQNSALLVSGVFSTMEINNEESLCSPKIDHLQSWLGIFVQEKGRVRSYDHMKYKLQSMFTTEPSRAHPEGWRDRSDNAIYCVLPLCCLLSSSVMERKILSVFGFMPVVSRTLPYLPFSIVLVFLYLSAAATSVTQQEISRNKPFVWGVCQKENTFRNRQLIS